jgi:putative flippase GtrA
VFKLLRFMIASGLATLTSAVVFPLVYRGADAGPRVATFAAFAAGAAVSFVVNRTWTWNRRQRAGLGRDMVTFLVVAGSVAVLAAIVTSITEFYANRMGAGADQRTILVEIAYLGTYAVMFVLKFLLLDRWVFRSRSRTAPAVLPPAATPAVPRS